MTVNNFLRYALVSTALLVATGAQAQTLTVGMRLEPPMDPHHLWSAGYGTIYGQVYGGLTILDDKATAAPMLATSWEQTEPNSWTFHLRDDVIMHNGEKFTSADVKASFERARDYPNTPAGYAMLRPITEIETPDATTVILKTDKPVPVLPHQLSQVSIVPASVLKDAQQADFQAGKASLGTGPYKIDRYVSGDRIEPVRNDNYFGEKPKWERVVYRFISDDAARVAALLAGQADLIDSVPPTDVPRLKAEATTHVFEGPSERPTYLFLDTSREKTPYIHQEPNPLTKVEVRKAISLAIDRNLIRDRVMGGLSIPVGQLAPEGFGGHIAGFEVPAPDAEQARQLLASAGYPDGFSTTMHCTNHRIVNNARICQAVAQMLARVGIRTEVQTMPWSAYGPQVFDQNGPGFTFGLASWGFGGSGESDILPFGLHSRAPELGLGGYNMGRYANAAVDAAIPATMSETDRNKRYQMQADVFKMILDDYGIIPLHLQVIIAAGSKDIDFPTRAMGYVFADSAVKKD